MVQAEPRRRGRIPVTAYSVAVRLRFRAHGGQPVDNLLDSFMDALADIDEADDSLLDWSVGADTEALVMDVDLTVTAQHHADAVAHAHGAVRRAAEVAEQSGAGAFEDADNAIAVFA